MIKKIETSFNNQSGRIGINTYADLFIIPNHRYESGDILNYSTTGLDVGGVGAGTDYYCIKVDDDRFRVSISTDRSDYVGLTSFGSGTHSFNYKPLETARNRLKNNDKNIHKKKNLTYMDLPLINLLKKVRQAIGLNF